MFTIVECGILQNEMVIVIKSSTVAPYDFLAFILTTHAYYVLYDTTYVINLIRIQI